MRARTLLTAVGIAGLLVVGIDAVSYAATGDALILGHSNNAGQSTTVSNTGSGPVLKLHASAGQPALSVNTNNKITNLNADYVDGQSASQLQSTRSLVYSIEGTFNSGTTFNIAAPAAGDYLVNYSLWMGGTFASSSTPTHGYCELFYPSSSTFGGIDTTTSEQDVLTFNGNAYWHAQAGETAQLICTEDAAPTWNTGDVPGQIVLTRLDGATVTPAVTAPVSHASAHSAKHS
jgi:hypothetical protein